jgi:arylsulfatase A-like enzyme
LVLLFVVVLLVYYSFDVTGSSDPWPDAGVDAKRDRAPHPLHGFPKPAGGSSLVSLKEPDRGTTFSLLGRLRAATRDGGVFVPMAELRSSWVDVECDGGGAASGGRELRVSWPSVGLEGMCIHVAFETHARARLAWHDSLKSSGTTGPGSGARSTRTACIPEDPGADLYKLVLSITPAGPSAPARIESTFHGMWILPPELSAPPAGHEIERCRAAEGWRIEPGRGVEATVMVRKGDLLELEARGPAAAQLEVAVGDDAARRRLEIGDTGDGQGSVRGTWNLGSDAGSVHVVSVALPEDAGSHACLRRLDVRRERVPAVSSSTGPGIEGVVVILIDTLRADHLAFLGKERRISTPALQALSESSVVFTNATAHSNYTKPSVGTLLTGVYPHVHRGLAPKARLRSSVELVSQHLQHEGIDTQAVVSNHFLNNRKFGFQRGWNAMAHVKSYTACLGGEPVAEQVRLWLEGWEPAGPFLAYIHLMDPHSPYAPPSSYLLRHIGKVPAAGRLLPRHTSQFIRAVRRGDEPAPDGNELALLRGFYRADVEHMDRVVGTVLDHLRQAGILDRVLLVVASDHGEEFMEHGGLGHGTNLRRELVHVPLLVRWPGGAVTGRIDEVVGLIDVAPTVLEALGVHQPGPMHRGRSLIGLITGSEPFWDQGAYLVEHKNRKQKGIVAGPWKMLVGRKKVALTHVRNAKEWQIDPSDHPVTMRYLGARMSELLPGPAATAQPAIVELTDEEKDRLRALGYLLEDK